MTLTDKPFLVPRTLGLLAIMILAGCTSNKKEEAPLKNLQDTKPDIVQLMPSGAPDKKGWATDITASFSAQGIPATTDNICSVLAVAQQESNFNADAPVPGLGKIAWKEIDRRADAVHVPNFLVHTALLLKSPDGKSYSERLE